MRGLIYNSHLGEYLANSSLARTPSSSDGTTVMVCLINCEVGNSFLLSDNDSSQVESRNGLFTLGIA